MTGLVELVGSRHARRAAADNADALARAVEGRLRLDPALLKPSVDDRALNLLDRDRVLNDAWWRRWGMDIVTMV